MLRTIPAPCCPNDFGVRELAPALEFGLPKIASALEFGVRELAPALQDRQLAGDIIETDQLSKVNSRFS